MNKKTINKSVQKGKNQTTNMNKKTIKKNQHKRKKKTKQF